LTEFKRDVEFLGQPLEDGYVTPPIGDVTSPVYPPGVVPTCACGYFGDSIWLVRVASDGISTGRSFLDDRIDLQVAVNRLKPEITRQSSGEESSPVRRVPV